jgi:hypothetical protein
LAALTGSGRLTLPPNIPASRRATASEININSVLAVSTMPGDEVDQPLRRWQWQTQPKLPSVCAAFQTSHPRDNKQPRTALDVTWRTPLPPLHRSPMFAFARKLKLKQCISRTSVFTCSSAFVKTGLPFVVYSVGLADGPLQRSPRLFETRSVTVIWTFGISDALWLRLSNRLKLARRYRWRARSTPHRARHYLLLGLAKLCKPSANTGPTA